MPSQSKIHSYPPEFSQLLVSLPKDGRELTLQLPDEAEAARLRLQFYNFLKWCRRNERHVPHLFPMYNEVTIAMRRNTLLFSLRGRLMGYDIRAALQQGIQVLQQESGQRPQDIAPRSPMQQALDAHVDERERASAQLSPAGYPTRTSMAPAPAANMEHLPNFNLGDVPDDLTKALREMVENDPGTIEENRIREMAQKIDYTAFNQGFGKPPEAK